MTQATALQTAAPPEWIVCPGCKGIIYGRRMIRNLHVCPECGRHGRLSAHERLDTLLDPDSVEVLDLPVQTADPLGFHDRKPYPVRLAAARSGTGLDEAVVCAKGTIDGRPVLVAVMDFRFMGGSLGSAVGELITRTAETALRERTPLLLVTASGGARMQEGAVSLMQMAKTSQALGDLDAAGILTISLITDPTFGGVAASFATLGDVIVAEPEARLGFAGRRVIEQTIRQTLPKDFQTAEFLLEHGLIDTIKTRAQLRPALARLLAAAAPAKPSTRSGQDGQSPLVRDPELLPEQDPWDTVRRARDMARPTALDYIHRLLEDFEELHGDRLGSENPAIVGGLGRLDGVPVMAIGTQKGHTTGELTARNFGMATPAGYRKAARLMRLAEKLGIPVLTFVDTPGAYPGLEAEEQGQAVAIAENIRLMAGLKVPTVAVVMGEGGSGGALALATADRVLMCANAVYSVISPEGCAAITWNDPAAAPDAAKALRITARELLGLGLVDGVVPEPEGGSGTDHQQAAETMRAVLTSELRALRALGPEELVPTRKAKFRGFGTEPGAAAEAGERKEVRS